MQCTREVLEVSSLTALTPKDTLYTYLGRQQLWPNLNENSSNMFETDAYPSPLLEQYDSLLLNLYLYKPDDLFAVWWLVGVHQETHPISNTQLLIHYNNGV